MAQAQVFRREYVGPAKLPAVGVYDENGKSMYGYLLGKDETYEKFVITQRFDILQHACSV